jgi:hypothetical protein
MYIQMAKVGFFKRWLLHLDPTNKAIGRSTGGPEHNPITAMAPSIDRLCVASRASRAGETHGIFQTTRRLCEGGMTRNTQLHGASLSKYLTLQEGR